MLLATVYRLLSTFEEELHNSMSLMLSEIEQQPTAIERTIKRESKKIERFAARLRENRPRLDRKSVV